MGHKNDIDLQQGLGHRASSLKLRNLTETLQKPYKPLDLDS